jgi:uncharacterized protein YhfF
MPSTSAWPCYAAVASKVDDVVKVCELGTPGSLRDRLVAAVLAGEKTATSSLLAEWESEGETLPVAGEHQAVVDSNGRPIAVIELLGVDVMRLGDADLQLALDEGEGFRSVAEWRQAHERFWSEEVVQSLPGHRVAALDDDTAVVVERFRLVSRI